MALFLITKNVRLRASINSFLQKPLITAINAEQLNRLVYSMRSTSSPLIIIDADFAQLDELLYFFAFYEISGPKICLLNGPREHLLPEVKQARSGNLLFLPKPFCFEQFCKGALELGALAALKSHVTPLILEQYLKGETSLINEVLIGSSESMQRIRTIIYTVAPLFKRAHISGETGTGKELVAQMLHAYSGDKNPLISINCATLTGPLGMATLFGHTRNAFTGAHEERLGLVKLADGGTLFLDEIELLDLHTQGVLLRLLDSGAFRQLGSDTTSRSTFRLITATNVELKTLVERQQFRPDLYHRINQLEIVLPPLREHVEDIPHLVAHRLKFLGEKRTLDDSTFNLFMQHHWPGNVRELFNKLDTISLYSCGQKTLSFHHVLTASDISPQSDYPEVSQVAAPIQTYSL